MHRSNSSESLQPHMHRDPMTGAPGAHPFGTCIGAAAAGLTGMAIGTAVPGIGSLIGGAIGATIGAVAGGLAGKGVAEAIDPTAESAYWRSTYSATTYYDSALDYDRDFGPAYRYGWEAFKLHSHRDPIEADEMLRAGWETHRGHSRLDWNRAQHAVRDAWDRVQSGDAAKKTPIDRH